MEARSKLCVSGEDERVVMKGGVKILVLGDEETCSPAVCGCLW